MTNLTGNGNNTSGDRVKDCINHDDLILIISAVILIFGVVGNIVTFFKIVLNKSLRRPVPISIACLAVADFWSLSLQFIRIPLAQCDNFPNLSVKQNLLNCTLAVTNSSAMHIILMAAIRYGLIVHPLQMRCRLTSRKVIVCSCISWVISLVLGFIYGIYNRKYYSQEVKEKTDAFVQLSIALYFLLVPITFFLIFYIMELRAMKRSLQLRRTLKSIKYISRMITVILILYVVFISPYVIADIFRVLYYNRILGVIENNEIYDNVILRIYSVAQIIILLNYAVNPFIYFLYRRLLFQVKSLSTRSKKIRRRQR
ncbi:histamine H2 receptor-like [Saccostrea echinata]|uniref:histamine H2 receptor-like n=1 Tax=Saccostrea echinata TaxID=191078 RepID=UPI002A7F7801|nr:histamine H2 receptor-like [Saccostrea echinata]